MRTRLLAALFLFCAFALPVEAATLAVGPASFIVHGVTPGKEYDVYKETGVRFSIHNRDDRPHTYVVSAHRPSARGRWEKGYQEIPDPAWCWFDQSEITVPANERGYVTLFVKVPDEERYYNRCWAVTVGVEGKAGPLGIALAIDVRVRIETRSKADVQVAPDGAFGVAPSVVEFGAPVAGETQERTVVVYNNEATTQTYRVGSLFRDESIRTSDYLTYSFATLPDREWLAPSAPTLRVGPKSSRELTLRLSVPAATPCEEAKWEDVLLVAPDEGPPGMMRVRIDAKKAAAPNAGAEEAEAKGN